MISTIILFFIMTVVRVASVDINFEANSHQLTVIDYLDQSMATSLI